MKNIIIGSRGSDLALWQANHIRKQLENLGHSVQINVIVTQGDAIQNLSFDKLEGKGFFTKEIEEELLQKRIDLAVHSHKDLETNPPAGLMIAAVSEREDPSELLLMRKSSIDNTQSWSLKTAAVIGTSSARRKALIKTHRPDLRIEELRGNVPTRVNKLREGKYDAILLAKAGVDRLQLDLSDLEVVVLDPHHFVPAPAQGVLGLQIREDDTEMATIMAQLHHDDVAACIGIERKVLNLLEGGCRLPLGVYCPDPQTAYVAFAREWEDGAQLYTFDLTAINDPARYITDRLLLQTT